MIAHRMQHAMPLFAFANSKEKFRQMQESWVSRNQPLHHNYGVQNIFPSIVPYSELSFLDSRMDVIDTLLLKVKLSY